MAEVRPTADARSAAGARSMAAGRRPRSGGQSAPGPEAPEERLPIRMLHDRVLVSLEGGLGERRSGGGIVIPATASVGKRLSWARVVATGPSVRQVQVDDRVLFDPEDRAEVELQSRDYVLLRERDLHAVAASRVPDEQTGLYL